LETWKHRQSAKRIRKTGTIAQQRGSGRPCLVHSSGGPRAQSGGQAKNAPLSSWELSLKMLSH